MSKSVKSIISRFAPAVISFLAVVLTLHVNSSSGCFILYQPKAAVNLDDFKKIQ